MIQHELANSTLLPMKMIFGEKIIQPLTKLCLYPSCRIGGYRYIGFSTIPHTFGFSLKSFCFPDGYTKFLWWKNSPVKRSPGNKSPWSKNLGNKSSGNKSLGNKSPGIKGFQLKYKLLIISKRPEAQLGCIDSNIQSPSIKVASCLVSFSRNFFESCACLHCIAFNWSEIRQSTM